MDQILPTEMVDPGIETIIQENRFSRPLHQVPDNIPQLSDSELRLISEKENVFLSPCKRFIYVIGLSGCLTKRLKPTTISSMVCLKPKDPCTGLPISSDPQAYVRQFLTYFEREVFKPVRIVDGCEKGL